MTKRKPIVRTCQFCDEDFTAVGSGPASSCLYCTAEIVNEAFDGRNMKAMAESRGVSKNVIIGLVNRNKPEGWKHPTAAAKRPPAPRKPKKARTCLSPDIALYGPPRNPREMRGCRHITGHVGEKWAYCQADIQPGSSYCPEHHEMCHEPARTAREKRGGMPRLESPGPAMDTRTFESTNLVSKGYDYDARTGAWK